VFCTREKEAIDERGAASMKEKTASGVLSTDRLACWCQVGQPKGGLNKYETCSMEPEAKISVQTDWSS